MEKLYCGGHFHFDYQNGDYVQKASEDYRAVFLGDYLEALVLLN